MNEKENYYICEIYFNLKLAQPLKKNFKNTRYISLVLICY